MSGKHIGIDLLRHGDTGQRSYRGQLDDALSPLGWTQLRGAIFGRSWDSIVTSPLRRCAEFAGDLATARRVPLRVDPRLAEYHFGDWQGVPIETLAEQQGDALGRFWADPVAHPPPGGEPFAAFRERLCAAINDVAVAASTQRVLVVTHGGTIRLLRCEAEGRDFGDMANLDVPHASLHAIDWAVPAVGQAAG
ncbi:MAG TPA: histidine phosphatase family protein [Dyella sp.]|uniref:histidine phosphatase family protein n=1 Tax=Dyella sp. TaxID=1869338 RepID=UPI002D76C7B6|nr:histidine phosphatase family protein [Dyella sp.]HET6554622.1 histidine phosphatase family protein [Dyella sp.]